MLAALGLASALAAAAPGDPLSARGLLAQDGRPFSVRALRGRAAAISFAYTRCEDAAFCPAVAGKFAWLARRIDPRSEHLVLITLDPAHDTPAALRAYAARLGTDPARLTLVTGDSARVTALRRTLGVSAVLRVQRAASRRAHAQVQRTSCTSTSFLVALILRETAGGRKPLVRDPAAA